jgi:hypothetical protein
MPHRANTIIPLQPQSPVLTPKLLDRFISKVEFVDGHWLWTGTHTKSKSGEYGQFSLHDRKVLAHRLSYELFVGPVPPGCMVLHACNVSCCISPNHLRTVDHQQNMTDRRGSGRTARGEHQGRAKLDEATVRAVLAADGTSTSIGRRFGLSRSHVANIRAGRIWRHLRAA